MIMRFRHKTWIPVFNILLPFPIFKNRNKRKNLPKKLLLRKYASSNVCNYVCAWFCARACLPSMQKAHARSRWSVAKDCIENNTRTWSERFLTVESPKSHCTRNARASIKTFLHDYICSSKIFQNWLRVMKFRLIEMCRTTACTWLNAREETARKHLRGRFGEIGRSCDAVQ